MRKFDVWPRITRREKNFASIADEMFLSSS